MKVKVQNKIPAAELKQLSPLEAKRVAADLEGAPPPPLTDEEKRQLSAQERLEKLKESKGNTIHKVIIGGEDWFIREFNYNTLIKLGMIAGTKSGKQVSPNILFEITKQSILMCVCTSETDITPYFTKDILDEYMNEPSAAMLMTKLSEKVFEINPSATIQVEESTSKNVEAPNRK